MSTNLDDMIPVAEAAEILGCTPRRVQQLLNANVLRGRRITDRFWLVDVRSVNKYGKQDISVGRPRKSAAETKS